MNKEINSEFTAFPVCPFCGNTNDDPWELFLVNNNDESYCPCQCPSCGEKIEITLHLLTRFSTEKGHPQTEQDLKDRKKSMEKFKEAGKNDRESKANNL